MYGRENCYLKWKWENSCLIYEIKTGNNVQKLHIWATELEMCFYKIERDFNADYSKWSTIDLCSEYFFILVFDLNNVLAASNTYFRSLSMMATIKVLVNVFCLPSCCFDGCMSAVVGEALRSTFLLALHLKLRGASSWLACLSVWFGDLCVHVLLWRVLKQKFRTSI